MELPCDPAGSERRIESARFRRKTRLGLSSRYWNARTLGRGRSVRSAQRMLSSTVRDQGPANRIAGNELARDVCRLVLARKRGFFRHSPRSSFVLRFRPVSCCMIYLRITVSLHSSLPCFETIDARTSATTWSRPEHSPRPPTRHTRSPLPTQGEPFIIGSGATIQRSIFTPHLCPIGRHAHGLLAGSGRSLPRMWSARERGFGGL